MPRRNYPRRRPARYTGQPPQRPTETPQKSARRLVKAGKCSPAILGRPLLRGRGAGGGRA